MSMKRIVICSFAMGVGLAALGWLVYPALLALAVPETAQGAIAALPQGALMHRIWSVVPLFPLGLAVGVSARFVAEAGHSAKAYGRGVLGFLVIGLAALMAGAVMFAPAAMATLPVDGMPQRIWLPLEALPLWKAGMCALAAVIVGGFVAALRRGKSSH